MKPLTRDDLNKNMDYPSYKVLSAREWLKDQVRPDGKLCKLIDEAFDI